MLVQLGLIRPTGPTHQWSTPTSFHLQLQCPLLQAAFLDCPSLNFPRLKPCLALVCTYLALSLALKASGLMASLPFCPYCLHVILINPASLCCPCPTYFPSCRSILGLFRWC